MPKPQIVLWVGMAFIVSVTMTLTTGIYGRAETSLPETNDTAKDSKKVEYGGWGAKVLPESVVEDMKREMNKELPFALQVWPVGQIQKMSVPMRIWLSILALTFFSNLLFVGSSWASCGLLVGFILHHITGAVIVMNGLALPRIGFISLLHVVFWLPGTILLIKDRTGRQKSPPYRYWSYWMMSVLAISYYFDLRDAFMYVYYYA
jgi:hypothetical protein